MPFRRVRFTSRSQTGVTLIEAVVFMVVVAIGLAALLMVFNASVVQSADPALRVKALEKGQALMDEILSRKFDSNTPTGGVPACNSAAGPACVGIGADPRLASVGDYHNYQDNSDPRYAVTVSVQNAGADLGLAADAARLVRIQVAMPDGNRLQLSAYKVNF